MEETSELKIIATTSLGQGKCDVETCRATGVNLIKASLPALQYYLSHVDNYETMSMNICWECHQKVEFFKKAKESILKGNSLLSLNHVPKFLKPPVDVIEIDGDDEDTKPAKKRKKLECVEGLDQVIRKVVRKLDIPGMVKRGVPELEDDLVKLDNDMKLLSDDIHSCYQIYSSEVSRLQPTKETRTLSETTINPDGTVTKTRLAPLRMRPHVSTDNHVQIIEELIKLDIEPQPEEEIDEHDVEQIGVKEKKEDSIPLADPGKVIHRPCPEVGWTVIAAYRDDSTNTECWVNGKVKRIVSEELGEVVIKFGTKCYRTFLRKVAYLGATEFSLRPRFRVVVGGGVHNLKCSCECVPHYEPGVIVESKRMVNNDSNYLVYLDSGECRYVAHKHVRMMCDGGLGEFLRERVYRFPETDEYFEYVVRGMESRGDVVKISRKVRDGVVVVVREGKWRVARIQVDQVENCKSDVVRVQFGKDVVEWLFRGSPRFHQVFSKFRPVPEKDYPGWYGDEEHRKRADLLDESQDNCLASCLGFEGVIRTLKTPVPSPRGRHSECDVTCVPTYTPSDRFKRTSPLAVPLHFGWRRTMSRTNQVVYVSPCGKRRFTNFKLLAEYLRVTESDWEIDWFCFDVDVDVCSELVVEGVRLDVKDISSGLENIPIRCVNYVDNDPMPAFQYTRDWVVGPDVEMMSKEESLEFMQCCDCTDNCSNYKACACRRMTVEGCAQAANGVWPVEKWLSYVRNRKLLYNFDSGVYECGERCACKKNLCSNRVVQNGIKWPLLVFKTKNKGWAVRATCDIPLGSFICVYAGDLNTEDVGEEIAQKCGDEYTLELVFPKIFEKVNKKFKPDYEAFAFEYPEGEISVERVGVRDNVIPARKTLSEHFPANQRNFIINPKSVGNVGRFFSHSCDPNMFLQHVFVGTHDPRFPQHAFFTSCLVKAGTELTWDYKYENCGGDEMPCHCGAANCKKRLM